MIRSILRYLVPSRFRTQNRQPQGSGLFSELLDARNLSGAPGASVTSWPGSRARFSATTDLATSPTLQTISGHPAVRFSAANNSRLDFNWKTVLSWMQGGLSIRPFVVVTAFADTGLDAGSGRCWAFGTTTLNVIGLNLRQSSTGMRFAASDNAGASQIANVFVSNDGQSQRSICTIRINANGTWDAWTGETRTITSAAIGVSAAGYSAFDRFTLGNRVRNFSGSVVYDLSDDCAMHAIGFIDGAVPDDHVLDAIRYLKTSFQY